MTRVSIDSFPALFDALITVECCNGGVNRYRPVAVAYDIPDDQPESRDFAAMDAALSEAATASWMKSMVDGDEAWVQARGYAQTVGQIAILFNDPIAWMPMPAPAPLCVEEGTGNG